MFESDDYIANKITDNSETYIRRKFFFPRPLVLYKIKFDEVIGDSTIIMKVELLGIDRETKQNHQHPFNGGNIFKRGVEWEDNNNVTITDRQFIDSQGNNPEYKNQTYSQYRQAVKKMFL